MHFVQQHTAHIALLSGQRNRSAGHQSDISASVRRLFRYEKCGTRLCNEHMHMILLVVLTFSLTLIQRIYGSTLLLELPCNISPKNVDYDSYLIVYEPPIGYPPSNSKFPLSRCTALITETISATVYNVSVSVVVNNGSMILISQRNVASSPDAPILDTIITAQSDTVLSFFPSYGKDLRYRIEYYPIKNAQQQSIVFETKATHIALTDLRPDTEYRLKIITKYQGIPSDDATITTFKTKGENDRTNGYADSPSGYNNQTVPPASETYPAPTTTMQQTLTMPEHRMENMNKILTLLPTATEANVKMAWDLQPNGTTERIDVKEAPPEGEPEPDVDLAKNTSTDHSYIGQLQIKPSLKSNSKKKQASFKRPSSGIRLSQMNDSIKVEWDQPNSISCDAYLLNCTVIEPQRSKSFAIGASTTEAIIEISVDQRHFELQVFCVVDGSVIQDWWAYRVFDFSRPDRVRNLRVVDAFTDSFHVSHVHIEWDWPNGQHSLNNYRIMASYTTQDPSDAKNEVEVESIGPLMITQLKPSERYIFIVKNISRESGFASEAVEVHCTTPPAITSILHPHQISSTSININFDESSEKYKFDRYLLILCDFPTNITREIDKYEKKSFNFTNLTPGQTYTFILYTLYDGLRSRAIIANATTYPLKLTRLDAVVGKNYVVLHWDVQSQPQSKCRFRLSYINTANIGKQNSSAVETINRKKFRFGSLASDTYYTFTVIVIMGTAQQEAQSKPETITVGIGGAHRSLPVLQRRDSRQLIVTFENDQNAFADVNGVVDNYAVIVSQDIQLEDDDDYDLRSWFDVHAQRRWPPYRASSLDYNPFRGNSVKSAKFIIGEEDCEQQRPNEKYCNGPLRANVNFFVKIRAYTMSNIAMETSWVSISDVDDIDEEYPSKDKFLIYTKKWSNFSDDIKSVRKLNAIDNRISAEIVPVHSLIGSISSRDLRGQKKIRSVQRNVQI